MGGGDDGADRVEYGRVARVEQLGADCGVAINPENELRKVVRADRRAALRVVAARSVVEWRQQISALRASGFQAGTVCPGLLLGSAFLALTAIIVGTARGLALACNAIDDAQRQATWPAVHLVVLWGALAAIFVMVRVVALATTYLPRAARIARLARRGVPYK